MAAQSAIGTQAVLEEDVSRARIYQLLARLLCAPPDSVLLEQLAGLDVSDDTPIGRQLALLAKAAEATPAYTARCEYNTLFIGLARGELVPYASYYLTGFLNEKPLAILRQDMARLGIARADGVREPEDHIAALCDMMAGLIIGSFGAPPDFSTQYRFFATHLQRWAPRFFNDLQAKAAAGFYRPVGMIGSLLMEIEASTLAMDAR